MAETVTVPNNTPVYWDAPTEDINGNAIDPDTLKYRIYLKNKIGEPNILLLGETKDLTWVVGLPAQGIFYHVGVSAFKEDSPLTTESEKTWSDSTNTLYVPQPFEFFQELPPPSKYLPPTNLHVGANPNPAFITLQSGGGDVWGGSFSPTWQHSTITGNFDFYAKVTTDKITEQYRQAGIIYQHSNGDSVLILTRYDNEIEQSFQRRDTDISRERSTLSETAKNTTTNPAWVRMEREGSNFKTYYATSEPAVDGDWTLLGPGEIEIMADGSGQLGVMAVHPGSSTFLAQFDFKPWL